MTLVSALSVAASLLAVLAGWVGVLSPSARRARAERAARRRRADDMYLAIFGEPERTEGALQIPRIPGLVENLQSVLTKLDAPLLNGKGDDLIRTVARLDGRSERHGRRLARVERKLEERS